MRRGGCWAEVPLGKRKEVTTQGAVRLGLVVFLQIDNAKEN